MSKEEKNPYDTESPEWQLWENMKSSLLKSLAFANDAERYTRLSQEAREKSERYREALDRLSGDVT